MQTDPALPWAAGTGGRILLRQPLTRQDLLDGLVQIVVAYERYGMHMLSVVDYQGNLKFADTSGNFYFDVAAFTGETSELELTAIDPNSEVISVMQFDEAPTGIISYPQLRWDYTVTEAIIKLPFEVTKGEMQAGLLRFGFMGQSYVPIYGDNAFQVKISGSDAFTFPFNGSTIKEIQLTRNGSAIVETVELQTSDVYTNAPLPTSDSPLFVGLKGSIDRDALLAGALLFNIKEDPADAAGDAEVYDASGTLTIGKTRSVYYINNITGATKSLTVTKMLENPSIESIERLGYIDGRGLNGISFIEDGDYAYLGGTLRNEQDSIRCLLTFDGVNAIRGQRTVDLEITNSDEIYEGSVYGEASIPQALNTLPLVKVKTVVKQGFLTLMPIFAPNDVGELPLKDTQNNLIRPGYSGNIYISEL